MKKLLMAIGLFFLTGITHLTKAQNADLLLNFIKSHPKNSSIYITKDDREAASFNENKMMPLANTMQLIIAIEFAKQADNGSIDTSENVALSELGKYFLPDTDDRGYSDWLSQSTKNSRAGNDSVSLINIAREMIRFGSRAHAELLLDRLELSNVNGNYRTMSIKDFSPIFYPVSSFFLYQNPQQKKERTILKAIKTFSDNDYGVATTFIHDQLKNNPNYKSTFRPQDLTSTFRKEWNDRLPQSTAKSYTHIGQVLNNRFIFNNNTFEILSQIIEKTATSEFDPQVVAYAGSKSGSTPFAFTHTVYASLKNGEKFAFSYFFDDISSKDVENIKTWVKDFDRAVMTDADFLQKLNQL